MTTLYVTEPHAFISKQGATLRVRVQGQGERTLPLAQVSQVVCVGDISWSGAALRELAAAGIGVAYLGPRGEWVGRWEPAESKAVPLRRAQFRAADDPRQALVIGRAIVAGKLRASRALLLRARREGSIADDGEIGSLATLAERAATAPDLDAARGLEGEGAVLYFRAYGRLVSVHGFSFRQRTKRPPSDPINAMLSFGYALLARTVATAVRTVGFDAHVGFLHSERYGRESLALDVMEEFRAPIVDALVATLVRKRMIGGSDFDQDPTQCRLRDGARRTFLEYFERKLETEIMHPALQQRLTHRRAIEVQARLLAKHLLGELPAYLPFTKR
jgi:CRISPR-associated protein Cas1